MADSGHVTVAQVAERIGLSLSVEGAEPSAAVTGAVVCDLLSFVMANGKPGNLWVTIQTHPNIVAVAALAGLSGIIISSGFKPDEETCERADEEGIALLTTEQSAYEVAGQLWALGVR